MVENGEETEIYSCGIEAFKTKKLNHVFYGFWIEFILNNIKQGRMGRITGSIVSTMRLLGHFGL